MNTFKKLLCAIVLISGSQASAMTPEDIVTSIGANRFPLDVSGRRLLLPFEASRPIDRPAQFGKLVILIHGSHRQVKLGRAAQAAMGVAKRPDTLLFVPQFLKDRDRAPHNLSDDVLSWAARWEWGDLSSGTARISSFEVTDRVILELLARYPSIREVVVIGNSAGGQFAQRYAALSAVEDRANSGGKQIKFSYLVSNPSSYLYFDDKRASASGRIDHPSPDAVAQCPNYNAYGYGLDSPNSYAKQASAAEIEARFLRRTVVYFIGTNDNDEDHPGLDTRCSAEMQGAERFERARNYWNHLLSKFGGDALSRQRRICVPDGTHNARTIWASACGRFYVAGTGSCRPARCLQ